MGRGINTVRQPFGRVVFGAVLLLAAAVALSLSQGKFALVWGDIAAAWYGEGAGSASAQVLWQLRLPRLLAGVMAGAALSAAGAVYQVMFRNPLVSPDILGVSSGAGLGAALAIFWGWNLMLVSLSAFVCGLTAVLLVYLVTALLRRSDTTLALVLTGVAVGSVFGALIALLKILADPYTQLSTITFWLMGGLNTVSYRELAYTAPLCLAGLLPLCLLHWHIDLLSLADEESVSMGLNVRHLRLSLIVAATLMTAAVVAVCGLIGWVGLVVPHVVRLLVGSAFVRVLPLSLLVGAAFLVLADTAARTVAAIDLPLSVLTAFIGAPFFIYLLIRQDRRHT